MPISRDEFDAMENHDITASRIDWQAVLQDLGTQAWTVKEIKAIAASHSTGNKADNTRVHQQLMSYLTKGIVTRKRVNLEGRIKHVYMVTPTPPTGN